MESDIWSSKSKEWYKQTDNFNYLAKELEVFNDKHKADPIAYICQLKAGGRVLRQNINPVCLKNYWTYTETSIS